MSHILIVALGSRSEPLVFLVLVCVGGICVVQQPTLTCEEIGAFGLSVPARVRQKKATKKKKI